ncbi:CU044_5270 family protein [Amycolatopsis kentuckyensis]|uniref:CU044_5270 family protein n=1 Tax=Amycolatopsis kentuckyensis TaxID=218823 RepID=UPI000A36A59D|nr:CU044_5270 family protein [Amycolatopsis kentuckyensis]
MTDEALDAALRRFHRAGPAPGDTDLATIRQHVLTRTTAPRRRPVRAVTAAVAASAAVAVAATVVLWPAGTPAVPPSAGPATPPSASPPGPDGTQAITDATGLGETVNLVVRRVANARPLDVGHGGYLYSTERALSVQTVTGPDGPASYVAEDVTERWSAVDEGTLPKLVKTTRGLNARPLTPADGARLAAYGTDYTKVVTYTDTPGTDPKNTPATPAKPGLANPTPAYLASLPTDPQRLKAVLEADGPIFKRVGALATTADALLSPALRSALYQVLATIPGVERVPGQVDLAGRPGVAIARTADGKRAEIVIDPVSSRMLGFRIVAVTAADGIPAGTVVHAATADQKIVREPGEKQ